MMMMNDEGWEMHKKDVAARVTKRKKENMFIINARKRITFVFPLPKMCIVGSVGFDRCQTRTARSNGTKAPWKSSRSSIRLCTHAFSHGWTGRLYYYSRHIHRQMLEPDQEKENKRPTWSIEWIRERLIKRWPRIGVANGVQSRAIWSFAIHFFSVNL